MEKIDFTKVEVFSADGETFYDDDTCITDYGTDNLDKGEKFTITIGKKREFVHGDFFHHCQLDNLIESMQERAYDEVGEVAETYLENLASKDNEAEFLKLVCDWIQKKTGSVKIWGVSDFKEVECVWLGDSYEQII